MSIAFLLAACVCGAVATVTWLAASNHPTPSLTALIPAFFVSAALAVALFVLACVAATYEVLFT